MRPDYHITQIAREADWRRGVGRAMNGDFTERCAAQEYLLNNAQQVPVREIF